MPGISRLNVSGSHQKQLAAVNRLIKDISKALSNIDLSTCAHGGLRAIVPQAVALGCLAQARIIPSWLTTLPLSESLFPPTRAADDSLPERVIAVDRTRFGEHSTQLIKPLSPVLVNDDKTRSQLLAALLRPEHQDVLNDPLAPGWAYQCLLQRPRWMVTGLTTGSNAQSTRAKDISLTCLRDLTQWFTPDWISRFLVEESISRSDETALTFFDPACGAGHLLAEALPALVNRQMKASGAPPEVALETVLDSELFGCDIDPYVIDLARFSLYLVCRRISPVSELPLPGLYHFGFNGADDGQPHSEIDRLSALGSLWLGAKSIPDNVAVFGPYGPEQLNNSRLKQSFSIVATNPPYLSHRLLPPAISKFIKTHYPAGRFDLYSAFVSLCSCLLAEDGIVSLICQQSFLSIQRYQALRGELMGRCNIEALVQLGSGVFAARAGEKVNSAIIVAKRKRSPDSGQTGKMQCWRILKREDKQQAEQHGIRSMPSQSVSRSSISGLAGSPLSFWCPPEAAQLFSTCPSMDGADNGITLCNGLFTCDNKRFVRPHWKLQPEEAEDWVAYDKGGGHKWCKTTPYMVYWKDNGKEIRDFRRTQGQSTRLPGEDFYFKPGITYSYIGTHGFRARLLSPNSIFDIASSALFSDKLDLFYILGFLNSQLARFLLGVLNPTVNFQIGDLRRLPFIMPDDYTLKTVANGARSAVKLAELVDRWDSESPAYTGPVLARYLPESGYSEFSGIGAEVRYPPNADHVATLTDAYNQHLSHAQEINDLEAQLQSTIDHAIFELYKVSQATRTLVSADPWVSRSDRRLYSPKSFAVLSKQFHHRSIG